jgi:hypothetical protein
MSEARNLKSDQFKKWKPSNLQESDKQTFQEYLLGIDYKQCPFLNEYGSPGGRPWIDSVKI